MKFPTLALLFCAWIFATVAPAHATFHLMQVQQVIGGVDADATKQAIQLRMRASFQDLVSESTIRAWDATGSNPVVIIAFPSDVLNHGAGVPILITSAAFNSATTPPTTADFTMTNLIPQSYLAAGSLTFESNIGSIVYWRLSWGGVGYTGPTTGAVTNDADGEFSPSLSIALPSGSDQSVLFLGAATALSTNNAADYAQTSGAAIFTNNAGQSFTVNVPTDAPPPAVSQQLRSWPNPFNPMTEIAFSTRRTELLTLNIYDPRGHLVKTLLHGEVEAGTHRLTWDGTDAAGARVGSGVYLARLRGVHRLETHKLVLGK